MCQSIYFIHTGLGGSREIRLFTEKTDDVETVIQRFHGTTIKGSQLTVDVCPMDSILAISCLRMSQSRHCPDFIAT